LYWNKYHWHALHKEHQHEYGMINNKFLFKYNGYIYIYIYIFVDCFILGCYDGAMARVLHCKPVGYGFEYGFYLFFWNVSLETSWH